MQDILEQLNTHCSWDCRFTSFDGYQLVIAAGTCGEYAKPIVEFRDVTYVACPIEFSHATFSLADVTHRTAVAKIVPLEDTDHVIMIEAETMGQIAPQRFYIVAESMGLLAKT